MAATLTWKRSAWPKWLDSELVESMEYRLVIARLGAYGANHVLSQPYWCLNNEATIISQWGKCRASGWGEKKLDPA